MEGSFDYYKLYLRAPNKKVHLQLLTLTGTEPDHYPVTVFDLNTTNIGTAANKSAYVALWNASPVNTAVGTLTGGRGPFSFVLELKTGTQPSNLTGDPIHLFAGIFANTFDSKFN